MGNALWSIPIAAIPFTLIIGFIYGYACVYNPSEKLAILLATGYGVLIGYLVSRAGKAAKCRSFLCMRLMGFIFGLFALYSGWAFFLYALLNRFSNGTANVSLIQLYLTPTAVWNLMININRTGWFEMFHAPFNGTMLWLAWGCEALLIVGITALMPPYMMKAWVFCEPCKKWCKEKNDIARFGAPLPGDQTNRLKAGDLTVLGELVFGDCGNIRLYSRQCESCGKTDAIEIKRYWLAPTTNGGLSDTSELLRSYILLDANDLISLQNALAAQLASNPIPTITPPKKV